MIRVHAQTILVMVKGAEGVSGRLWVEKERNLREDCLQKQALMGCVLAQLPNGWLWDMVDEFVYQFQSWQQYRGKLNTKSAEELETLRNCDRVWSILSVLNYLQALVDKSGIVAELSTPGKLNTCMVKKGGMYRGHRSLKWQGSTRMSAGKGTVRKTARGGSVRGGKEIEGGTPSARGPA